MFELLAEQIAEAERLHREYLAASGGEFVQTHVQLTATGMSTAEFVPAIAAMVSSAAGGEEE